MSSLSDQAARRLRPEGPFHIPPPAQEIRAVCQLVLEDCPYQPEVYVTDTRRQLSWHFAMHPDGDKRWKADIRMPVEVTILQYHFIFDGEGVLPLMERRQEEGRNTPIYGSWVEEPFKIAVYDPARMPAEWTHGMIIYQIFPDRFSNGDTSTDRVSMGVYGHQPLYKAWGEQPEHPPLGRDFFGGDLRGVIERLDYLADLGIDCIYFTPIFHAPSNHRYDAIDYFKIDPMLGTERDFEELLEKAHQRGIKIILDAVFNHCSSDSIYFDIVGRYGEGAAISKYSPYYRWFDFTDWPKEYRGWMGLGFMPEFVECPEVEEFFVGPEGVAAYWLHRGIDGWRCDVAFDNSDEFWRRFRKRIDTIRPGAYSIAELWIYATHYMLGDTFNGAMNYRLGWALRGFCLTDSLTPSELDDRLMVLQRDTPALALHAQMNILDSHDTNRILSVAQGDRRRVKQSAAFQFACPGAPMIYYGSETGLEGMDAEDGRRCMPWNDLDQDMLGYYKHLIRLHKSSRALRTGDYQTVVLDDARRLYGFARRCEGDIVIALFNGSDAAVDVRVPLLESDPLRWREGINGSEPFTAQDGVLLARLEARGAAWLMPS
jgi:glycosidase